MITFGALDWKNIWIKPSFTDCLHDRSRSRLPDKGVPNLKVQLWSRWCALARIIDLKHPYSCDLELCFVGIRVFLAVSFFFFLPGVDLFFNVDFWVVVGVLFIRWKIDPYSPQQSPSINLVLPAQRDHSPALLPPYHGRFSIRIRMVVSLPQTSRGDCSCSRLLGMKQ